MISFPILIGHKIIFDIRYLYYSPWYASSELYLQTIWKEKQIEK